MVSYLDKFNKEQQELLVSLPYRTGLLVSESDDEGGEDSAEAELLTLESLITGYAQDYIKSEFVEELMKKTLASKDKWQDWSEGLDAVPDQCMSAVKVVEDMLDAKDTQSFRTSLMEISKAVAMAYREVEEEDLETTDKVKVYGQYYMDMLRAKLKSEPPPNMDEYLNISHSEREVLTKLSEALQVDLEGNPYEGYV